MTSSVLAARRADGLELLGPLGGSGYRAEAFIVRRRDGQTLQLTSLLYQLLDLLDGRSSTEDLAADLSDRVDRAVSADDISVLLEKLSGLGLVHGSEPEAPPTSNPLLALRWKVVVSDPDSTRRLTAPFAALFSPFLLWPVLAAFVGVCWFVLVDKGLASATHQAFASPGLLLAVFVLTVVSAGIHELGHAAACRYGGARPGAMGAGLYLVWPAFYTNVDDSYRLDRRGRLRVDLGGLYFNALVAVIITVLWSVTGADALLLGVATQLLQMVRQLAPIVRADGYHILADLTGVPDLFAHLGPTLRGLLPSHWGTPSPLTRRARIIVTAWVLVVVPVLLSLVATAVLLLPRLIATAWTSGQARAEELERAAAGADFLGVSAALLEGLALALPVLGSLYITTQVVRRTSRSAWSTTEGKPFARGVVTGLAAVIVVGLLWTWWPSGQYTPVSGTERGTLPSLVRSLDRVSATPVRGRALALAMVPRSGVTDAHPALFLTKEPSGLRALVVGSDGTQARALPFSLPHAPRPGDTQALAVNTKDGATVYDIAYALVTVTDGRPAGNASSAFALASCTACRTVAVSFQIVLVVGHSDVVPVNAAVAANKSCVQCDTLALAVQVVATVNALPSSETRARLEQALRGLDGVKGLSPAEVIRQVQQTQAEVMEVLQSSGLVEAIPSQSAIAVATASSRPASTVAPTQTESPTATSTPTSEASAAATPSASSTAPPSPEPTPTGTVPTDPATP